MIGNLNEINATQAYSLLRAFNYNYIESDKRCQSKLLTIRNPWGKNKNKYLNKETKGKRKVLFNNICSPRMPSHRPLRWMGKPRMAISRLSLTYIKQLYEKSRISKRKSNKHQPSSIDRQNVRMTEILQQALSTRLLSLPRLTHIFFKVNYLDFFYLLK